MLYRITLSCAGIWPYAPSGPVILEANGNFACSSLQKPGPEPLIDEKFLAVFEYWRERGRVDASMREGHKG